MKKADQQIADKILSHQISLMRFTAGEKKKVFALFLQMQRELTAKLQNGFTSYEKERITKLLKECTAIINGYYGLMEPVVKAVDPLIAEAQGFASAKSFIKSQTVGYHGSSFGGAGLKVSASESGEAIFFTDNSFSAEGYGRYIHEATLNIKKPFVYDAQGKQWFNVPQNKIIEQAKKAGHDAVIFENILDNKFGGVTNRVIAVFDAKKVKVWSVIDTNNEDWYRETSKVEAQLTALWEKGKASATQTDLVGLAKAEAAASTKAMASIGLQPSIPTAAVLKAMVSDTLLTGAPLKDWWAKQAEDTAFKFVSQVRQGVAQGETLQQIITRVVGSTKKGIVGIMEVSQRNASTLVHDSIMQIANDAKMAVFQENADILKGVQQLSTLDSRTSAVCIAYSGAEWDLEGNPINGTTLPFDGGCPRHPNCLTGDTIISAAGVSKHYKSWFDGEVVVLSITGIDDVTITPNHPVLTDHGWIKAGLLKKGDNLIFCEDVEAAMLMLNPNNHHMETRIEDIGDSLLMSGGVTAPVMPSSPEDFHGDGTIDNEVGVILADSQLTNNGQAGIVEQVKEDALSIGHSGGAILDTNSAVAKFLIGGLTTTAGSLSGNSAGSPGLGTSEGSLQDVGLADTADMQSKAQKTITNDTVMAAKPSSDFFCRLASLIGFVKLNNISVRKFTSHVYNLQCDFGWYIVNITEPQYKSKGIIVHNCRSVMVPITKTYRELGIDIDEVEVGTRASDLGQVPADMTFDAFLKRHDAAYQDEMLGKGKAKLYREGKITLKELVTQSGRPMTLEQLQAGL